jgi:uncharacterized protein YndB with AHSA1/START domain
VSGHTSVTASVEVAVDPTTAFEVFTQDIDAWYKRGPHSFKDPRRAVGVRFEPGVGGRLLEVHDAATGEGIEWGRVLVWEPGARLVFSDLLSSAPPAPLTEVEVRFASVDGGTRVTLEHRGLDRLPPEVAAQKREHGWIILLGWFDEHVPSTREGAR